MTQGVFTLELKEAEAREAPEVSDFSCMSCGPPWVSELKMNKSSVQTEFPGTGMFTALKINTAYSAPQLVSYGNISGSKSYVCVDK